MTAQPEAAPLAPPRRFRLRIPVHGPHPALLALAGLVAVGLLLPFAYLLLRALEADPAAVVGIVLRPRNLMLLGNTLALVGLVLALSTLVALPLAWLTARSDLGARRLVTVLSVLPLAIPGYVMAYALIGVSGYAGLANTLFGLRLPRPEGLSGAAFALTLYIFPYLFLNLRAALLGTDAALEETARSLGLSPGRVFLRVTLPQLIPAFASGWLVITLYVLGDFGVVALMRYEVFSYAIFTQYSAAFDRTYAAWLSLMLLAVGAVAVGAATYLGGRRRLARIGTGVARRAAPVPLGRLRPVAIAFLVLLFGTALGLPTVTLAYWMSFLTTQSAAADDLGELATVFASSLSVAGPAAVAAGVLAVPLAVLMVRYPSGFSRLLERTTYLGYGVPPLAFALAMVFLTLSLAPFAYQTRALLVLAFTLHFLALALGPPRTALMQMGVRPEQAARALGYGRWSAFLHVSGPRLRRPVAAGALLVFVVVVKELPITFLLAPPGFTTLATRVFSYTSEGLLYEAAPYAALLVVFSSLFVGLMVRYEGSR
ncbi:MULTISPECIES: ABC transporter permease [unclassified Xanthobacter]|uniref:ABC transporter permease n=1 Tax=unclassified Xanthobacter TaxID=2623496 RepID=UPI001EDF3603|nr:MULTISPECIES: iron ABC transporter permease [unclassified Xanthobacter]